MDKPEPCSKHLARRKIEAEMIGRIYAELIPVVGVAEALAILTRVIERSAFEDGASFAKTAEQGPSLSHFKTILDHWGDALEVSDVAQSEESLRFDVTRCEYVAGYQGLGLPAELVKMLSCRRDAPFAKGYSRRMELLREHTLADGAASCDFCYHWQADE